MANEKFDNFVRAYQLWLINIGHSWFVYCVGEKGLEEKVLKKIKATLPPAAVYREVRRITDATEIKRLAKIVSVNENTLAERLSAVLPKPGFQMVLGLQGWGC